MTIQALNSTNNITFQGTKTKKTPRGNEYPVTNTSRTVGATTGLLSGALVAKIAAKSLKTPEGKRSLIKSFNNMGKDLSVLGSAGKRSGAIGMGIKAIAVGLSAIGMFVGATIGGAIDSHNNQKRAKAADKAAKINS